MELLPRDNWVDNYKSSEPTNALFEAEEANDAVSIEDKSNDGDKQVNLIELVNSEEKLQVTGKVRGVLKKLSKTYGGSVLKESDMLPSTKAKLEMFFKNCAIVEEKRQYYRVFVPYNNMMPQGIMRVRDPA